MSDIQRREASFSVSIPGPSLQPDEPLPIGMKRMTTGLLSAAIGDLRQADGSGMDRSVHAARKKLKRLRGLVRLVRDEIGYRPYREENVVLRDTARSISAMRDAWVNVETLRLLRSHYDGLLAGHTFDDFEQTLLNRHRRAASAITRDRTVQCVVNLGTARSRFAGYPVEQAIRDDFPAIAGGLGRVYRRGRRGYHRAREDRSTEGLHEWRKRVKYLRYQMEALTPLQPVLIGGLAAELDRLGELLGDDHDLAALSDLVRLHPLEFDDARQRWLLAALAYERRVVLQREAFTLGEALYSERPREFVQRIGAMWAAGRR